MSRFENGGEGLQQPERKLWVCAESITSEQPDCEGELVYPLDWLEPGESSEDWRLHLMCPDCRQQKEVVCTEDEITRLDEITEAGQYAIVAALRNNPILYISETKNTISAEEIASFVHLLK